MVCPPFGIRSANWNRVESMFSETCSFRGSDHVRGFLTEAATDSEASRVWQHLAQLASRSRRPGGGEAAVRGADGSDALQLHAAATAHVAWQVHASLHLGHPELRRKGSSHIHSDSKITTRGSGANKHKNWQIAEM